MFFHIRFTPKNLPVITQSCSIFHATQRLLWSFPSFNPGRHNHYYFFCWWFVFELSARHEMKAKIYVNFSPFFDGKFALGDLCSNDRFLIVLNCVIVLLKSINLGEFLRENCRICIWFLSHPKCTVGNCCVIRKFFRVM